MRCVRKCMMALFMVVCLSFLSCYQGKQEPLHQLEELTEDIREHHEEYSTSDWKQAYERYEQIAAEIEKYQYTTEEAEKMGQLEGECVGYFMKSAVNSIENLESEINGFIEGLNESLK